MKYNTEEEARGAIEIIRSKIAAVGAVAIVRQGETDGGTLLAAEILAGVNVIKLLNGEEKPTKICSIEIEPNALSVYHGPDAVSFDAVKELRAAGVEL